MYKIKFIQELKDDKYYYTVLLYKEYDSHQSICIYEGGERKQALKAVAISKNYSKKLGMNYNIIQSVTKIKTENHNDYPLRAGV